MKDTRRQGSNAGRDQNGPRYSLPSLGYGYTALEPVLSGEIVELHYAVHHAAYVKGANKAADDLVEARSGKHYDTIAKLERDLVYHFSGHVLHSLLWRNLSPHGGGLPDGDLADAIDRHFGSLEAFRAQMNAVCLTVQGSGWGALCWDPLARQLLIEQVLDHHNNIGRCTLPILVIDMWEHAYYLQFKNRKEAWLEAYWQLIDWQDIARRFAKVRQTAIGL
jgi:Fe-Mn family superoxide dismutase